MNPFKEPVNGRVKSYATFVRNQIQTLSISESKMIEMSDGSDKCKKMAISFYPGKSDSANKLVRKCGSAIRATELSINAKFKTKLDADGNMWVMRVE